MLTRGPLLFKDGVIVAATPALRNVRGILERRCRRGGGKCHRFLLSCHLPLMAARSGLCGPGAVFRNPANTNTLGNIAFPGAAERSESIRSPVKFHAPGERERWRRSQFISTKPGVEPSTSPPPFGPTSGPPQGFVGRYSRFVNKVGSNQIAI